MIDSIISFSVRQKPVIGLLVLLMAIWGLYSLTKIPIDAVPDITNNQVQIITRAPSLATQEVERLITAPLELHLANLPGLVDFRSISRFGLSVITVVFEDDLDQLNCRQLVAEQLARVQEELPGSAEKPELAPISTGLGEIYQYIIKPIAGYEDRYSPTDLRTIQDWIVKRQLAGIPGVIEINSFGGRVKQFEVQVNPYKLGSMGISAEEVGDVIADASQNAGSGYIERSGQVYFIRGEGMLRSMEEISMLAIGVRNGVLLRVRDVAEIREGHELRYGAMTSNGEGEAVGGIVMMLKGANSSAVLSRVHERMEQVKRTLPEGIEIHAFLDRSELVSRAIQTVKTNLIEGGLIVILVLVLFLGNIRAGIITASVIPLSLLFAFGMMHQFGVSANLMSLGAIDFGLVVDGSVIIVEAILFRLHSQGASDSTNRSMDDLVIDTSKKIRRSAAFGEIIILIVYLPILSLSGIEGKMFAPMAQTVSFAIIGALILSFTYVPMMAALVLKKSAPPKHTWLSTYLERLNQLYAAAVAIAILRPLGVLVGTVCIVVVSVFVFSRLGGEFIPTLDEGDFAVEVRLRSGASLSQTIEVSTEAERILLSFDEVKEVVSKIGTSQIPTDPMPLEANDLMVILHPPHTWRANVTKESLANEMKEALEIIPGVHFEFLQPIEMRFNELMTGVKSDVAVKIYGDDLTSLTNFAEAAAFKIQAVRGVQDLRVEELEGLPQIQISYNREELGRSGISVVDANKALQASVAGIQVGYLYEGIRRFGIKLRFDSASGASLEALSQIPIKAPNGAMYKLGQLATVEYINAPVQINRDNAQRRIAITFNVRNRDIESTVFEIQKLMNSEKKLPPGYFITYGGQFTHLDEAKARLAVVVPLSLLLIFALLFFTFNSATLALVVFMAIPLSAVGGILALWLRDMPFSISAGVGFIALFGVAVLNGIVLISSFQQEIPQEDLSPEVLAEQIAQQARSRMRPVLITATVASLGFLPMAISQGAGAEVQKPLATVVIGGLFSATFLTLFVLPILYAKVRNVNRASFNLKKGIFIAGIVLFGIYGRDVQAQQGLSMEEAVILSFERNQGIKGWKTEIDQAVKLSQAGLGLPKSLLDFQYGQTQAVNTDYTFAISQEVSPFSMVAFLKVARKRTELAEVQLELQKLTLAREVRLLFVRSNLLASQLELAFKLDSLLERVSNAAQSRFKAGASGSLESVSAAARSRLAKQRLFELERELVSVRFRLKAYIGDSILPVLQVTKGKLMETVSLQKTDKHPSLVFNRLQTQLSTGLLGFERSKAMPDFRAGYLRQSVEGIRGLQAAQAGISVPIFFNHYNKRISAARLAAKAQEYHYQEYLLQWESNRDVLENQFKTITQSISITEATALSEARYLVDLGAKAYQAGEIDFLSFAQLLQQSIAIEERYLEQIAQYNFILVHLKFLYADDNAF